MKAQSYAILAVLGIIGVAVIVYYKQITALFSGVSQGVTDVKNALVTGIGVPVASTIAKGLGLTVTGTSNGIVQVSKTTTSTSNPSSGTAMIMVGNVTQANVPAGNLDHNGNTYSFSQLANDPAILGSLQSSFFPTYNSETNSYGAFVFPGGMVSIPVSNVIQTPQGTANYSNGKIALTTTTTTSGNIAGVEGW